MRRDKAVKGTKEDIIDWFIKNMQVEQQRMAFESLRKEQASLKNQLKAERFFISPIRKLLTEIFVEIFGWAAAFSADAFYPDVPDRRLALVCKSWRDILLHSTSLWNTIDLSPILTRRDPHTTLNRRLELAYSTNLDVVLSANDYSGPNNSLLQILENVGLHRWRSLVIKATLLRQRYGKHKALKGSLGGLRTLTTDFGERARYERSWTSRLHLAGNTGSILKSFTLIMDEGIPELLAQSHVLSNVVLLNIPGPSTNSLLSLAVVKTFELTSYNGVTPVSLPPCTILRDCRFDYLARCELTRVTELTVSFIGGPPHCHDRD
jgi:hypothetical protein